MRAAISKLALLPLLTFTPVLLAQTASATPPAPASSTAAASPAAGVKLDQQESFIVVGLTVRTNNETEAGGEGKIPDLWQRAMEDHALDQIPNHVGDGIVVVYSDYASDHTGDYNYTLGMRVSSADKVPAGFVARTIRPGRYAVIASEQGPPQQVIPALWERVAKMKPAELGGTRAYQTDFETYAPFTDPSSMQMSAHIGLQ